jgi:hypothetical protein
MLLRKKIMICLVGVITAFTLTGCGKNLKQFVAEDLQQSIVNKFEANRTILGQLYSGQFISKDEYDSWLKSLNTAEENLSENFENIDDGKLSGDLVKSISKLRCLNGNLITSVSGMTSINDDDGVEQDIKDLTTGSDLLKYSILSNFTVSNGNIKWACSSIDDDCTTWHTTDDSNIKPISIIDDKLQTAVQEKFDYTIYVLKPNLASVVDNSSIDNVITAVNACLTSTQLSTGASGFTVTDTALLDNYFTKAVDSDGNAMTLISKTSNGDIPDEYKIVTLSEAIDPDSGETGETPGKDLLVSQYGTPELTIRFQEFNQEHWNNLREVIGLNENQYIFCTSNGEKRAYLMEYPVYYLDSITYDDSTDTVTGYINDSSSNCSLGLNLASGKIIKYAWDAENNSWSKEGSTSLNDTVQSYLTTTSDQTNNTTGLSSFIIKGACTIPVSVTLSSGNETRQVTTGRIILRDYLEATYAPGFVDGESLVVFGRKIRVNFNNWTEEAYSENSNYKQYIPTWSLSETFATYVDSAGNRIDTLPTLQATDFGDIYAVRNGDSTKWTSNVLITLTHKGIENGTLVDGNVENGVVHDVDDLPHKYDNQPAGNLMITAMFPNVSSSGISIGASDWNSDNAQKQRFYVMFVARNMFDSSLFSQWINVDSSSNSLNWWNEYLASYGYTYKVNHEAVNEYLQTNYKYELSQNGLVILDLDVVNKVSQIYQEEDDEKLVSNIKTFFLLLGWFLICYSIVLMLAWTLDANTDIGVKLLERLTLGNWVAVKYETDIPYKNTNDRTYLTCGKMIISCMILITVGVILINVNIFRIVLKLISLFGTVASQLEEVILGARA